jgi:glycosyltransferase involved in cell wall biosynthesis
MVTKLLWVLQHPTPYNTYLLNQLGSRLGMDVEAVYRWPELSSHPWSVLPARHFGWRVVARPGERDAELERRCATDDRTFIVFAGWRDRTIRPALMARARSRSPFAFWTDTPKTTGGLLRRVLDGAFVHFARRAVTTLATGVPAVERYRAVGVPDDRLENFPFVVDPEHFGGALVVRSGRRAGGAVGFLIPARLVDRLKGQSVALEALRIAREHAQGVRLELILAGVGPDGDHLRLVARQLRVADAVRFEGWVEYAAMPALLGAVDALVLPSHWDPFPVAVIEAMAAGLPVLGSDACGSVRERVVHGESGFVHHAGDSASLAEHMRVVAEDSMLRAALGRQALHMSSRWGIEHCAGVLRRVLAPLVATPRSHVSRAS